MSNRENTFTPIFASCVRVGDRLSNISGVVTKVTQGPTHVMIECEFGVRINRRPLERVQVQFGSL